MTSDAEFAAALERLDQSIGRVDAKIDAIHQQVERLRGEEGGPTPAETAVAGVLVLHDRPHWCYDLKGGSSWYSRDNHWPCLTMDVLKGAGIDVEHPPGGE